MVQFLTEQGRPPNLSNPGLLLARFPKGSQEDECTLLLGTYVEIVDREVVIKEKELLVNTLIGVLITKTESARIRAVPRIHIALTMLPSPPLLETT